MDKPISVRQRRLLSTSLIVALSSTLMACGSGSAGGGDSSSDGSTATPANPLNNAPDASAPEVSKTPVDYASLADRSLQQ